MPELLPSDFVTRCCGCGEWLRCPKCSGSDVQAPILACEHCGSATHPSRSCGRKAAEEMIDQLRLYADGYQGISQDGTGDDSAPAIETVDHPQHDGGDTPHETIKCLAAWGLLANACLFNVVKHVARAGKKPGVDMLRDLKAARWYLDYEIRRVESGGTE